MKLLYKDVAKERGYNKLNRLHYELIEKQDYVPFVTNPGDDTIYSIGGFDPNIMLPDEAVYKPKKKDTNKEPSGLENFMEKDKE